MSAENCKREAKRGQETVPGGSRWACALSLLAAGLATAAATGLTGGSGLFSWLGQELKSTIAVPEQ